MPSTPRPHMSVALLLCLAVRLSAHHSAALYDLATDIRIEGEVVRVRWANPHVYVEVRATNAPDEDVVWAIEGQAPSGMTRAGWTSSSLVPGDRVVVAANPARDATRRIALGHTVLKADGSTLFIPQTNTAIRNASNLDPRHVADGLAGHRVTRWDQGVARGFLRPADSWAS